MFACLLVANACLAGIAFGGDGHTRIKAVIAQLGFIAYVVWRELVREGGGRADVDSV